MPEEQRSPTWGTGKPRWLGEVEGRIGGHGLVWELLKEHCREQGQPGQTTWWRLDCIHLQVFFFFF